MTVPVPEGQDRIDFRTKGNRVWIGQLVYARAGESVAPPKPPALVRMPSNGATAESTVVIATTVTKPEPPTGDMKGAWGYESPTKTQGAVLDIDTLNALIQEFDAAIARAEAGNSAHPAFIDHLKRILANLVSYRDALVANNPDPAKSGGWGVCAPGMFDSSRSACGCSHLRIWGRTRQPCKRRVCMDFSLRQSLPESTILFASLTRQGFSMPAQIGRKLSCQC